MKKLSTLLVLTLISAFTFAQCNGRYQTEIFTSTDVTTVNYSDVYTGLEHRMDIYTASGDTVINRPVIFYLHGGSFYAGDKSSSDCVDFCNAFAKRGYVAVSLNYRLANIISFLTSNTEQYKAVLKAVADLKAGIRYFRKDYANGDTYGIDPNTIFIGGYSAGAVATLHTAFIDSISDLSATIQVLLPAIGGTLEGDSGNDGFSSQVSAVYSFAGGVNETYWIDSNDEPMVSCQGTADQTVSYNCAPALNNPNILTLCGSGEMHARADSVGLLNDHLSFQGEDHNWAASGNSNSKFIQAVNFTSDFLYNLLPCNQTTSISQNFQNEKMLIRIIDVLGRESKLTYNAPLFYIYNDGTVEKKLIIK
ncbi:MAG: alpha/beta hydrolase [Flavobacteriales bacterium]|nr:alpha/beta hydrolase [Flavobacteriales bacterium]